MRRRTAFNRGANSESGAKTRTQSEGPAATGQKGKSPDASTFQPITWGLPNPRLKEKQK
jgi:hypothetical protein